MPRSTSHHPRFDYQDYATRLLINRAQFEDDDLKRRIDAFYEHESYEDGSAISDAEEDGEELRKLQEELLQSRSFQWANQVVAKLLEKANSADILEKLSSPIVLEADLTEERLEELSRGDDRQSWKAAIDAADDIVDAFYKDDATNIKQEPIQDAPENVFKIGRVKVIQNDEYDYTYEVPRNFTGVIADPKGEEPFATDFRIYYKGALVCIVPALDVIGLSAEERAQRFEKERNNALARQQQEEAARRAKPPLSQKLQDIVDLLDAAFNAKVNLQGFSNDDLNKIVQIPNLTHDEIESILEELHERGWSDSKDDESPLEWGHINKVVDAAKHELALRQALTPEGLEQIRDVLRSVVEGNKVNVDLSEVPALIESLDTISSLDHRTQGYLSRSVGCNPVKFNELLNDVREQLGAIQQAAALEQQRAREAARKAEEDEAAQAAAQAARQEQVQPFVNAVNQRLAEADPTLLPDETLVTLAQISGKAEDEKEDVLNGVNKDRNREEGFLTKEDLEAISNEAKKIIINRALGLKPRSLDYVLGLLRAGIGEMLSPENVTPAIAVFDAMKNLPAPHKDWLASLTPCDNSAELDDLLDTGLAQLRNRIINIINNRVPADGSLAGLTADELSILAGMNNLTDGNLAPIASSCPRYNNVNKLRELAENAQDAKQLSLPEVIDKNNITHAQLASGTVPEGREQEVAEMLADLDEVKAIMALGDFAKVTAQHLAALQKMCGRVGIDNPNAALFTQIQAQLDSQQRSGVHEPAVEGELASKFWEVFSRTHFLEQYKDAVRGKYGDKVQAVARYREAAGGAKGQGAKASNRSAEVQKAKNYMAGLKKNLENALGLASENFPQIEVPYLHILSDMGHPVKDAEETVNTITGNQLQSARQAESKESELTRALRGRASSVSSANPGDQTTPPKRPASALPRTESGRGWGGV